MKITFHKMIALKIPYIDPYKVHPLKDVVSSNEHPKIRHRNIFETSNNCGG